MKRPNRSKRPTPAEPHLLPSLLWGWGGAALLTCLSLLLAALLLRRSPDPDRWLFPVGLTVRLLGAWFCGWIAMRKYGRNGTVTGLLAGAVWGLVLLALSLALPGTDVSLMPWIMVPVAVLFSVFGAGCARPRRRHRGR